MKNSSDTIGNRTRDLTACSAVPQPTALLQCPPLISQKYTNFPELPSTMFLYFQFTNEDLLNFLI